MRTARTKYVVTVFTTAAESKAYGSVRKPFALMFDPTDGEFLGASGRTSGSPSQPLIDLARDFAMHEFDSTK